LATAYADDRGAQQGCPDERHRPDDEQVLGAQRGRERPRREAADDGAEDVPRAEEWEQALGPARVGDEPRRSPQVHRLNEGGEGRGQPERRVDPAGIAHDDRALERDDADEEDREPNVGMPAVEAAEDPGQQQHPHDADCTLREVDDRERIRTGSLEEQGGDAALADRHARDREEHERNDEGDRSSLAALDPEDA
jgi:hypothetical protein